ncbi:MAG: hypothetical protein OEW53_04725 [Actinomycetota bacterium]|nr:hypothetical protein [Actinomycetota bacterium]
MARTPEPRPALTKAPDGGLHPAAPKAVPAKHLHPAPQAPSVPPAAVDDAPPPRFKPGDLRARKAASKAKAAKADKKDDLVDLGVQVPKKLRKAVRKKATKEGWTAQDAVIYVLRAWTDK